MNKVLLLLVLISLLLGGQIAAAQEVEACDIATIQADQGAALAAAATIDDLHAVSAALRAAVAECAGLSWTDAGAKVLGPLDLEAGLYLIEFGYSVGSPYNYLFIDLDQVDGDGEARVRGELSETEPTAQSTFEIEAGSYIIKVDGVAEEWNITITKLD